MGKQESPSTTRNDVLTGLVGVVSITVMMACCGGLLYKVFEEFTTKKEPTTEVKKLEK